VDLATSTATGLTEFQNIEGVIGGNSAGDTLRGPDFDSRFVLTGANQGSVNGSFNFSSIETLQGGPGNDTVSFQPELQSVGSVLISTIDGGSGNLTLEGDRVDFRDSVVGTGQLNIQPLSSDRPIRLGENTGNSTLLELSSTALSALQGFSNITIGLPLGNGLISGLGDLQLSSPLTLQSLGLGGAIDLSGATLTTTDTAVTLQADQSIQTGAITTNGGPLSLIASGAITTGDLNTSGNSGGNLLIQSQTAITTGAITTQGFNGRGGDVLLDPPGDVQVTYIDARGTTQGGNVSITTGSLFRATGLIPGTLDSISTAGSLTGVADGGSIRLYHNGVALGQFFVVGNGLDPLAPNGTLGGISSGNLRIPAGQYGQTIAVTVAGQFNTLTGPDERPNINIIVDGILNAPPPFTPETGCPPDCIENNTPEIDLPLLNLPRLNSIVELSVEDVETEFTDDVAEYNGVDRPPLRPLPDIQGDLQAVEDATGVKPAIIYVVFTPTTVNAEAVGTETPEKVISKPQSLETIRDPEVLWEFSDSTSPLNLAQAEMSSSFNQEQRNSDELELVLVTAKGDPLRIRVAGANRARVEQAAFLLRQEVSDPGRTNSSRYLQPSRLLYNWIIRPLENALTENEIQNLVFVMDSGLRSLPVAALNDGERFLIEKYSAGMMPSLSLTDTRYRDIRQARLLGMGSSTFQDQSDLPTVPLELKTIAGEIWKNGEYYLNDDFTIDNLQNRSKQFGIIHLATHADFLPGNINNSYIALSRERLNIDRIRDFGWHGNSEGDPPVELLTLSACKTAIGSDDAELGFAGLAVQTGVKTALASLWYVSDAATTGLMTKFYGFLAEAQQAPVKAEALRQAQLAFARGQISVEGTELRGVSGVRGSALDLPANSVEILNDRDLSHPYYWASFTLVGSPW
jgi:CHAT domain-containing protein